MRDPKQKTHDQQMVAAWRENLTTLVSEAELAFDAILRDETYADGDEGEWLDFLEQRSEKVRQRSDALVSHVVHARNYLALIAEQGVR